MNKVLITGGSGLIGSEIIRQLADKDFEIVVPTRGKRKKEGNVQFIHWDPERNEIDPTAMLGVNYIVNLAGANLADGRWTDDRKEVLLSSRIDTTEFLIQKVKEFDLNIKGFVSASAIGYYGNENNNNKVFTEQDEAGNDFLAEVCVKWENALMPLNDLGIRKVVIRIGLVLSKNGGLMEKILPVAQKALNTNFGDGEQNYAWIHIEDIARMFVAALENEAMQGVYNGTVTVAQQLSQKQFNKALSKYLKRPVWLPGVPSFALKIALGQMADLLLSGNKISNEKLIQTGFQLKYPTLNQAFKQIVES